MHKRIITVVLLAPDILRRELVEAFCDALPATDHFIHYGEVVNHLDDVHPIRRVPAPNEEAQA